MNKPIAYINNWFVMGTQLIGMITKHPRQDDGTITTGKYQLTSEIVQLNRKDNTCTTENTEYTLGTELSGLVKVSDLLEAEQV